MSKRNFIQHSFDRLKLKYLLNKIQTPLAQAVAEMDSRSKNRQLRTEVSDFLGADIPPHFRGDLPIFYLSRYIATPDYETLHFYKQVSTYDWPVVIGEDTNDIFTGQSSLKRNLLKLPIVNGVSKNGNRILQYVTVADFNTNQGKRLCDITLANQLPLHAFHQKLCRQFLAKRIQIVDESGWVDRNARGKLVTLYESMLALFLVHGIMLEQYETDEIDFLESVVLPAVQITKKRFGYTPLIAPLNLNYSKKITDLNSYPGNVGAYAKHVLSGVDSAR